MYTCVYILVHIRFLVGFAYLDLYSLIFVITVSNSQVFFLFFLKKKVSPELTTANLALFAEEGWP